MFCKFHLERLAQDQCSLCNSLICSDCHRVMNGKVYCPECLSESEKMEKTFLFRNPILAASLGIFPGLGQVYNKQLLKGLFIFFTSWLIIPWLYGIYDAYVIACRFNRRDIDVNPSPALLSGCLVLILLIFGFFSGGPLFIIEGIPVLISQLFGGASERQAEKSLEEISDAIQAYRVDHGEYPENENDLYFGDISYLTEMYCDTIRSHYLFKCDFADTGYEIKVIPLKEDLPSYRMRPGPIVEKFAPRK